MRRLGILRGTFKMITPNHVRLIENASKLVDDLYVFIDSDNFIENKGRAKVLNETERTQVLRRIKGVYDVRVFTDEDHFSSMINGMALLHYDVKVYFKGGDYAPRDLPEAKRLNTLGFIVCCLSFQDGRQTSEILKEYVKYQ